MIFEADVKSFFDKVHRRTMLEMLGERIADKSFMRLVGKCLNVGVLDGQVFTRPDEGTVQGSIISPMLGNIYLHNVLDKWFEEKVKPRLKGKATLIRYADDLLVQPVEIVGGCARVPEGPGLGIEVDEDDKSLYLAAVTAADDVPPRSAAQGVGSVVADDGVGTVTAAEFVVARSSADNIVCPPAAN